MNIRYLEETDFNNGFFETLSNLTTVGSIENNFVHFKNILKNIDFDKQHILVAHESITNNIIGTASILIEQKFIHNGSCVGHIEDVVVRSGYESKGIGSLLIDQCINIAKKYKCYKIILDCKLSNVKFYEKFGFHSNELCMRLNLE